MAKKPIKQWERMAYLWQHQGLSLREIQSILDKRGLKLSHEFIRHGILAMEHLLKSPLDNGQLFATIKKIKSRRSGATGKNKK